MDLQKFLEIEILSSKKNNARRFKVLDNFVKIENNQLIDTNYSKFINIFTIVFILFMIIIFIRIFDLQIIKYIYYKELSDRNYLRGNVIYPSRGLIFDRNKNFLVKNVPYFFIYQNVDKCINREVEVDRYKVCYV